MNIKQTLTQKLATAMQSAGISPDYPQLISKSKHPTGGDFQVNGILAAANQLKTPPRDLAQSVVKLLDLEDMVDQAEVGGPGFINIHLSNQWIEIALGLISRDERIGVDTTTQPQTVVVDYSAPNLAKEMHVGHLRSTVIGDAHVKLLEYLGHKVIRQNHIGDWGTQFGMLIAELEEETQQAKLEQVELNDLEAFYRQAKKHFDESTEFANKARHNVVKLQGGDPIALKLWKQFIELSLSHTERIYKKLDVSLTNKDIMGESSYNKDLPLLVKELKEKGLAVEDQGAIVAFLEGFPSKDGEPSAVIIKKSQGGYLYATTDLAAIRFRVTKLRANCILYFIDARQSLHMEQVFALAKKAQFSPKHLELRHCAFGTIMDKAGKPFKTRSGDTVKLDTLLDEAVSRAKILLIEKESDLSEKEVDEVARKVGIGSIKYADLSKSRTNDYVFDWETMLSFSGNTAPYLQYAYTRIKSVLQRAHTDLDEHEGQVVITDERERELALELLGFDDTLQKAYHDAMPHYICSYLYELAKRYMAFYEHCPIISSENPESIKQSRLTLCCLAARTLKTGLSILGIEVMEKM